MEPTSPAPTNEVIPDSPQNAAPPDTEEKRLFVWLAWGSILFAGFMCTQPIWSNDVWWHLSYGRYIWQHGSIPVNDVFTWTHTGQPTAYVPWLSSTIFYMFYHFFGAAGLVALKGIIGMLCVGLSYQYSRKQNTPAMWFVLIFAIAIWLLSARLVLLRSLVTPFILLPVLFLLWEQGKDNAWSLCRWCIPLVMVVWVNSHGSFPIPLLWLGLSLTWPLIWDFQKLKREWIPNLLLLFATIIATCVTPTGTELWKTLLLLTLGSKDASIMKMTQEVLPVKFSEFFGIWVPAFIIALLALFSMIGGEWKKKGHQFILLAFVFWMMLKNRRFAGTLGLIGLLYLPQWIAFLSQETASTRQKAAQYGMGGLFVVLLVLAPFWSYQYYKGNQVMFMTEFLQFREKKTLHPYNSVTFLKQHKPKGKLYNLFDVGGFIHWKLPTRKVFIDGRTNILFKEKFFYTHYAKHRGKKTLPKHLDTLGVSMAILAHKLPMTSLLYNDPNWVPVVYDDKQALFLKHGMGNNKLIDEYGYRILRIDTNARRVVALWSQLRRQRPGKFNWLCNEVVRSVRQSTYKSRRLFWQLKLCKKIHNEIQPISPPTNRPTTQRTTPPTTQPKKPSSSQPAPPSR